MLSPSMSGEIHESSINSALASPEATLVADDEGRYVAAKRGGLPAPRLYPRGASAAECLGSDTWPPRGWGADPLEGVHRDRGSSRGLLAEAQGWLADRGCLPGASQYCPRPARLAAGAARLPQWAVRAVSIPAPRAVIG